MSPPRWARKKDKVNGEVVKAFLSSGCLVHEINGAIDLLIYEPSTKRIFIVDAKTPRDQGGRDRETDTQKELLADGWPLLFIRSAENAIDQVSKWRGGK